MAVERYAVIIELLLTPETGLGTLEVAEGVNAEECAVLDKDRLDTGENKEETGIGS